MNNNTEARKAFNIVNYTMLFLVASISVLPFVHIIAASFASYDEIVSSDLLLFPRKISLDAYRYIFSSGTVTSSLGVSARLTLMGTSVNMVVTTVMAYALSKKALVGRKYIMIAVIFTMLFNGGMVPTFLVVKGTGLIDSIWALILPVAISPFNLILIKNFFQQLPEELEQSAEIDGCGYWGIFLRIILPLSKPVIATFTLFYAVRHWNQFFHAILYLNDSDKWPIQIWLRQIVLLSSGGFGDNEIVGEDFQIPSVSVKMGVIAVATVPILLVYPFLQKYFAKGVLLGSVKG